MFTTAGGRTLLLCMLASNFDASGSGTPQCKHRSNGTEREGDCLLAEEGHTAERVGDLEDWQDDEELLKRVLSSLPGCSPGDSASQKHCCTFPRRVVHANERVPADAFRHGPLILENLTSTWRAPSQWTRPRVLKALGNLTVSAGIPANIADRGALLPAGSKQLQDGSVELPLHDLLQRWQKQDKRLFLFQGDRGVGGSTCNSLECLLTAHSNSTGEAEYEVPRIFRSKKHPDRSMDSLIASVGASGQGLPLHGHGGGWLSLVRGRKLWLLYWPGNPGPDSSAQDLLKLYRRNSPNEVAPPFFCVQEPGETVVVPHLWPHATMNIGDAIGVAGQVKGPVLKKLMKCLRPLIEGQKVQSYAEGFAKCGL